MKKTLKKPRRKASPPNLLRGEGAIVCADLNKRYHPKVTFNFTKRLVTGVRKSRTEGFLTLKGSFDETIDEEVMRICTEYQNLSYSWEAPDGTEDRI